jgi:hypothetical protein
VIFHTEGLLSKWGFEDGDMLDDLLWDCGYRGTDERAILDPVDEIGPIYGFAHVVLIVTVVAHVLPAIDQVVDVYTIGTIHNPIRARTVDGVAIDEIDGEYDGLLTPATVEVPDHVITTIAGALHRPPDSTVIEADVVQRELAPAPPKELGA